MSRLLLLLLSSAIVTGADVVVVNPTGIVTITGVAPGTAAAGEVRIGGGALSSAGPVTAGDVFVNRSGQATGSQAARGDDPRLIAMQRLTNRVFVVDTTKPTTSSATLVHTGVSITLPQPIQSATSAIRVQCHGVVGHSTDCIYELTLYRSINGGTPVNITPAGTNALANQTSGYSAENKALPFVIDFTDIPGATGTVSYQLWWRKSSGGGIICLGKRERDLAVNQGTFFQAQELP